MTTYDELANLMASVPRIPRRELKCHPVVAVQLRNYTRTGEYTMADELTMLTGIPVYESPDMDFGACRASAGS